MNKKTVTLISLIVSIIVCSTERYIQLHEKLEGLAPAAQAQGRR